MGASKNEELVECPQCGARVKHENLEEHLRKRCEVKLEGPGAQEKARRARDSERLWQRAKELAEAGDYQQAAEVCTELMDLDPGRVQAYVRGSPQLLVNWVLMLHTALAASADQISLVHTFVS